MYNIIVLTQFAYCSTEVTILAVIFRCRLHVSIDMMSHFQGSGHDVRHIQQRTPAAH